MNTLIGAVSLDVTHAVSDDQGVRHQGQSLRIQYGTTLSPTHTRFSVANYSYSSDGYRSLSDHVADSARAPQTPADGRLRERLVLGIDQSLGSQRGSLYLQASRFTYWNQGGRNLQWQAGYNNQWHALSYNLSATWSTDSNRTADPYASADNSAEPSTQRNLTLQLSYPLGSGSHPMRVSSTLTHQSSAGSSASASLSGYVPGSDQLGYVVDASRDSDNGNYGSASLNDSTSFGRFEAGYNQGRDYRGTSLTANGSVVAHVGGVNLGQSLSDTFGLVEVRRLAGVRLSQFSDVQTGRNGFAVVPSAQPYRANWLSLDTHQLGAGVEIDNAVEQVIPRRGAVTVARFIATTGRRVQFELSRPDGSPLPLGAHVEDARGKPLAVVDPTSRALVLSDQDQGELKVHWSGESCVVHFVLPAPVPGHSYERIAVQCQ